MRYGLIAGNGRFPVLALENARKLGHEVVAIGIQEEASREIEPLAARCHWISLGELSRLIDILKSEGITEVILCTNSTLEGDATATYLARLLKPMALAVTRLATGLPVGGDLEFADELTLGRALRSRRDLEVD